MSAILGAESVRWEGWPACPCGCGVETMKLNRFGHAARVCRCRSCLGRNNRSRGQRKQSAVLKAAARAQGLTMEVAPTHEEQARLLVHYEVKSGDQVPKGLRGDWMRHTEAQARQFAERQVPVRKWACVFVFPDGRKRLWMDFEAWLALVAELVESP